MQRLKDNLVIQFLAIFFAVMTVLAVVILLILTPRLTGAVDRLDDHYAATVAGVNVSPTASFSIPSIKEDILDLRLNTYLALGGGFSILYLCLILVVWRGWTTIDRQRGELMAQAAQSAREDELRNSRQRIVAAQESVRRDIAQQLHGSVQNRLIMLIIRLKELEDADQSVDVPEGIKDLRMRFEELLDKEIRSISHQLYPMILRRGLIPALQSLGD
jgi:signal transduction histidine kinase